MMFIKEENDDTSDPEPCRTENEHQGLCLFVIILIFLIVVVH